MKKLFIVLAVASLGFVACNNESKSEPAADTTATAPAQDTTATAPAQDTTAVKDTTAAKDTLKK
jgi:hypothetical protein